MMILSQLLCTCTLFTCRFGREHSSDPMDSLPKAQSLAIESCKEQLGWLLKDEMASAMRLVVPVTATTLQAVAEHVKSSVDRPKCVFHSEHLHFVYGPKKSMEYFTQVHCNCLIFYVETRQYKRTRVKLLSVVLTFVALQQSSVNLGQKQAIHFKKTRTSSKTKNNP